MGFFSKPSMPVPVRDALDWQARLYNMPLDEYLHGTSTSTTQGTDYSQLGDVEKGNPFFTATNQPTPTSVHSQGITRPFLWQGNNKSLRKVNQDAYSAYWDKYAPSASSDQQATWGGPQIRPEYMDQANGLSHLGTPSYWQDNNHNHTFDANADDVLDTSHATQDAGAPQSSALDGTPAQTPPDNSFSPTSAISDWFKRLAGK